MKPRPIRMPDSLWDELGEEAEERGLSTAEYVRKILRNRQANTPNTQADTLPNTQALAERVEELEAAVFDEQDAASEEHREAVDVNPEQHTTQTTVHDGDTADSFIDEYRAYLEANGPQKRAVREQVVRLLEALRERGPLTTGELKDVLEEEVGDDYGSRKSMWESYNRHVKSLPGFEKADYGEWDFAGEEETRSQL